MVSGKENDNSPATELQGMKCCDLPGKEFRIAAVKKFIELQENTERQSQ